MTTTKQRLIDLLAMSRFANLPTVWSNVMLGYLVGCLFGIYLSDTTIYNNFLYERSRAWRYEITEWSLFLSPQTPLYLILPLLCLPVSLLYLGGCFLNDWKDADFDLLYRPERPIPSGRFQREHVLAIASSLLFLGVILAGLISLAAMVISLVIVACIIIYTHWHKSSRKSLLFMAGSRVCLYAFGALSFLTLKTLVDFFTFDLLSHINAEFYGGILTLSDRLKLYQADLLKHNYHEDFYLFLVVLLGLFAYILGISLFAKKETVRMNQHMRPKIPLFATSLLFLPALTHLAPWLYTRARWFIIPFASSVFLFYLIVSFRSYYKNRDIGMFVSRALAGIPNVDFIAASIIIYYILSFTDQFPTWSILLCFPFFTLLSLLLQKIAPAT